MGGRNCPQMSQMDADEKDGTRVEATDGQFQRGIES